VAAPRDVRRQPRGGVRAVYRDHGTGQDPEVWESRWAALDLDEEIEQLHRRADPATEAIRRQVGPGRRVLEAGCGSGRVAGFIADLKSDVCGIDFASVALAAAKRHRPDLDLAVADVRRAPFADGRFDVVVSLGVIEHFVDGPTAVMAEHRRLVRDDGMLVLVVPRLSALKRWADLVELRMKRAPSYRSRRNLVVARIAEPHLPSDRWGRVDFYQYELSDDWLRAITRDAGFEVVRVEYDRPMFDALKSPRLRAVGRRLLRPGPPAAPASVREAPGASSPARRPSARRSLAHAAHRISSMQPANPVERAASRALGWFAGHVLVIEARAGPDTRNR
jgi:SAM-dependent methyltransferase